MSRSQNSKLLRTLSSGIKLHLRTTAEIGKWKRIAGLTDEDYFSKVIGDRVDAEVSHQVAKVVAKTGQTPDRVVIEDDFHDSPSDVVRHAGVVYEDSDGNHLSKKHVAENPEEQAKSDGKTSK